MSGSRALALLALAALAAAQSTKTMLRDHVLLRARSGDGGDPGPGVWAGLVRECAIEAAAGDAVACDSDGVAADASCRRDAPSVCGAGMQELRSAKVCFALPYLAQSRSGTVEVCHPAHDRVAAAWGSSEQVRRFVGSPTVVIPGQPDGAQEWAFPARWRTAEARNSSTGSVAGGDGGSALPAAPRHPCALRVATVAGAAAFDTREVLVREGGSVTLRIAVVAPDDDSDGAGGSPRPCRAALRLLARMRAGEAGSRRWVLRVEPSKGAGASLGFPWRGPSGEPRGAADSDDAAAGEEPVTLSSLYPGSHAVHVRLEEERAGRAARAVAAPVVVALDVTTADFSVQRGSQRARSAGGAAPGAAASAVPLVQPAQAIAAAGGGGGDGAPPPSARTPWTGWGSWRSLSAARRLARQATAGPGGSGAAAAAGTPAAGTPAAGPAAASPDPALQGAVLVDTLHAAPAARPASAPACVRALEEGPVHLSPPLPELVARERAALLQPGAEAQARWRAVTALEAPGALRSPPSLGAASASVASDDASLAAWLLARARTLNGTRALAEGMARCTLHRSRRCAELAEGGWGAPGSAARVRPLRVLLVSALTWDGQKQVWIDQIRQLHGRGIDFTFGSVVDVEEEEQLVRELRALDVPIVYMSPILPASYATRVGGVDGALQALARHLAELPGFDEQLLRSMLPSELYTFLHTVTGAIRAAAPDVMVFCSSVDRGDWVYMAEGTLAEVPVIVGEVLTPAASPWTAADVLLSPSRFMCGEPAVAQHVAHRGLPCAVVHPGVDVAALRRAAAPLHTPCAARALQDRGGGGVVGVGGVVTFGYVGRLSSEKAVGFFVRAVATVQARLPGVRVRLEAAGAGVLLDGLVQLARGLGVDARFWGAVYTPELQRLMCSWTAVVLPSVRPETWGLAPLEAMALGVPLVTFGAGGASEFLRNGSNALVVNQALPDAMADALLYLAQHPRERAALAAQAYVDVQELSVEASAREYRALYTGLVQEHCCSVCGQP